MNAEIREMPEYNVAYIRKLGAYCKETCEPTFSELMQWASPRNYVGPGKVLAIYWDNPDVTPAEKCRFDACVIIPQGVVPEGHIYTQTISAGPYAVCHFEVKPENMQQAWEDAFTWFCARGYECNDKPCYKLYHNNAADHAQGKYIFDICIPLKNKG